MKIINNDLIRSLNPCYDPSTKGIPDNETLTVHEWVEKYRNVVPAKDILWLLLRNEFYDDRQLRLFAVWCTREALKMVDNPDQRSVSACDIAERYANGESTDEELRAARTVALAAARTVVLAAARTVVLGAARTVVLDAALADARAAERDAAWDAVLAAEREKLLNYLLTL